MRKFLWYMAFFWAIAMCCSPDKVAFVICGMASTFSIAMRSAIGVWRDYKVLRAKWRAGQAAKEQSGG